MRTIAVGHRHRFWVAYLGAALYAAFLIVAPFGHHDLICHLKTPQHCAACTSTQLGPDPRPPATLGACHLSDTGRASVFQPAPDGVLLAVRSTGRSPPVSL